MNDVTRPGSPGGGSTGDVSRRGGSPVGVGGRSRGFVDGAGGVREAALVGWVSRWGAMWAGGWWCEAGASSLLVGSMPRSEPPGSGWGCDVRGAERRACRSGDRRSKPGAPCGGGARRALRACGPRAGLKTGGPRRRAIAEAGTFQAGALPRHSGGRWFLRSRDLGEQAYATPPAGGGLCRLKPAFQAGGAIGRGARRALRACGPRAGLKTGGPGRRAIAEAGTFQAGGALPAGRRSGRCAA